MTGRASLALIYDRIGVPRNARASISSPRLISNDLTDNASRGATAFVAEYNGGVGGSERRENWSTDALYIILRTLHSLFQKEREKTLFLEPVFTFPTVLNWHLRMTALRIGIGWNASWSMTFVGYFWNLSNRFVERSDVSVVAWRFWSAWYCHLDPIV